jgi:hypothetical protein
MHAANTTSSSGNHGGTSGNGSGGSPSSPQGDNSVENDNKNNNNPNDEVKSDREQKLEMVKQRLEDQRTILENELRRTDPDSQLFNELARQYIKTKKAIDYINDELSGSNKAKKLSKIINKVLNQEDTQPGYPDDNGNLDTTWCNRAAERIISEKDYDTSPFLNNDPYSGEPSINWTDANSMARNAAEAAERGEIQEVTAQKAQELANKGVPVLGAQDRGTKTGHVGVVAPSNETYDPSKGPLIGQAGNTNRTDYAVNSFNSNYAVHYYVPNEKK